jgi:hypothetical protein
MLNRTGHFWKKRYHSTGFDKNDNQRAIYFIFFLGFCGGWRLAVGCASARYRIYVTNL